MKEIILNRADSESLHILDRKIKSVLQYFDIGLSYTTNEYDIFLDQSTYMFYATNEYDIFLNQTT